MASPVTGAWSSVVIVVMPSVGTSFERVLGDGGEIQRFGEGAFLIVAREDEQCSMSRWA